METNKKRVYCFGGKTAEGNGTMRELLGGKGDGLDFSEDDLFLSIQRLTIN